MIQVGNALNLGTDPDRPEWDTMAAIRNVDTVPIDIHIQLRDDDGMLLDPIIQRIEPGLMWAASFIPGNGFKEVPKIGWNGDMTILASRISPFGPIDGTSSLIPFFLLAFDSWAKGVNAPFRSNKLRGNPLAPRDVYRFAYAIPNFDDTTGDTKQVWCTGAKINNRDDKQVSGKLVYVIGQNYAEKGQRYEIPFKLGAYEKTEFDLLYGNPFQGIPGLLNLGYPVSLNSEGHVDIVLDEVSDIQPSMLIADRAYSFTVTEDYDQ